MYLALGLAVIVPILFSIKHFLIRMYSKTYPALDLSVDSSLLETLTLTVVSFIYGFDIGFTDVGKFCIGSLGGLFVVIAKVSIAQAVAIGLAGPS